MNVLVVDDELPIREWLKFTIEKCAPQGTGVICASNGQEALSLFQSSDFDMVFTDIKMPVMDGLELLRRIREKDGEVCVVLLTSYADFNYAREALSMKAEAYILKNEISRNVIEDIFVQYDRNRNHNLQKSGNDLHVKRAELFKTIIGNKSIQTRMLMKEFPDAGITLEDNRLITAAVRYRRMNTEIKTPMENLVTYDENLKNITCFIYDMETYIFAANVRTDAGNTERHTLWNSMSRKLEHMGSDEFYVGISEIGDDIGALPDLLSHSIEALDQYFYTARKVNLYEMKKGENLLFETQFEKQISELTKKIDSFSLADFKRDISALFDSIALLRPRDITGIKKRCADMLRELCKECGKRLEANIQADWGRWDEYLMGCDTFFKYRAYYEQRVDELMDKCLPDVRNEYIRKVILYICRNYREIESIDDICRDVNINKEYLCRLFKKETGKTINTYLTRYRLDMARKLLRTTSLNIAEIAEQTGYLNTNYFSRIYKSIMGVNPKDDRSK